MFCQGVTRNVTASVSRPAEREEEKSGQKEERGEESTRAVMSRRGVFRAASGGLVHFWPVATWRLPQSDLEARRVTAKSPT